MIPEKCIGEYLASRGFGELGKNIFVNTKPPIPDELICIFGYGGSPPLRTCGKSLSGFPECVLIQPGIQVWVRSKSAATARDRIEDVWEDLDGIANAPLSGVWFLMLTAIQSPIPLGPDANGRTEYTLNFSALIER
jgi:hypothetical protein